jgi:hypothetical protein
VLAEQAITRRAAAAADRGCLGGTTRLEYISYYARCVRITRDRQSAARNQLILSSWLRSFCSLANAEAACNGNRGSPEVPQRPVA